MQSRALSLLQCHTSVEDSGHRPHHPTGTQGTGHRPRLSLRSHSTWGPVTPEVPEALTHQAGAVPGGTAPLTARALSPQIPRRSGPPPCPTRRPTSRRSPGPRRPACRHRHRPSRREPRATPPSRPAPVSMGTGRGRRAGGLPGSLGHALPSGSVATSLRCVVLAVPWGGDPCWCAGEGIWDVCGLCLSPARCLGTGTPWFPDAWSPNGSTEQLEEAAGLGAGHGHVGACGTGRCGAVSRLAVVVGTCWLCPGDRVVASRCSIGTAGLCTLAAAALLRSQADVL